MRKYFVCFVRTVFKLLGYCFVHLHLMEKKVIVRVDGGICSQIHFYLIGQLFAEKGEKVEYDLSWFGKSGKDLTGNFDRNFDLLKFAPSLHFVESKRISRYLYSSAYCWENDYYNEEASYIFKYLEKKAPIYLSGYYRDPSCLYIEKFGKYFNLDKMIFDNQNLKVYCMIQSKQNSVAVHVRRGDLSNYVEAYGHPASYCYFYNAIKYMNGKISNAYYFFFSDEPDWVKNELIVSLPLNNDYLIVDINGSDRGYMDLGLMASCKHFITSKGSLGKYASLLCKNKDKIVTLCNEDTEFVWLERIKGSLLINM